MIMLRPYNISILKEDASESPDQLTRRVRADLLLPHGDILRIREFTIPERIPG